jgi:hypothetical protein
VEDGARRRVSGVERGGTVAKAGRRGGWKEPRMGWPDGRTVDGRMGEQWRSGGRAVEGWRMGGWRRPRPACRVTACGAWCGRPAGRQGESRRERDASPASACGVRLAASELRRGRVAACDTVVRWCRAGVRLAAWERAAPGEMGQVARFFLHGLGLSDYGWELELAILQ